MKWENPPLQDAGSKDCEYFATAYIMRLLGYNTDWKDVREWSYTDKKVVELYPLVEHKVSPYWTIWHYEGNKSSNDYTRAYSRTEGFKEWVISLVTDGCVGYAHTFHVEHIGHAMVMLEADDEGILFADSARGLVKDSWEKFIHPLGRDHRYVSRVQTWYKIR